MNTIVANRDAWTNFDWEGSNNGDRWSGAYGSAEAQWFFALYPRIHQFLPASTICEIAPGHGRWTHFLLQHCDNLIGVDLTERCVDACRERFKDNSKARFVLNDGLHLFEVDDDSVDFVFSMDSLVHCDRTVVSSYVKESLRVLKPGGYAFFHHSNLGLVPEAAADNRYKIHWRARSVSADTIKTDVISNGGGVRLQELVNWSETPYLLDCYTLFRKAPHGKFWRVENPNHMQEAALANPVAKFYSSVTD